MVLIAGSQVALGDNIYIQRAASYGQVTKLLSSHAIVRVTKGEGYRDFTVQTGGIVAGERGAYWFPPLQLDLPKSGSAKWDAVSAVVDVLLEKL